jgi:hypothetical protein
MSAKVCCNRYVRGILLPTDKDVPVPRLTNHNYLLQREFLVGAWKLFPVAFTAVSYNRQLEVHAFFQPSKYLTDDEALAHRARISQAQPSLPNSAGKIFTRMEAATRLLQERLANQPAQDPTRRARVPAGKGQRHIRVVPLSKPEVDVEKLAEALLDLAEQLRREEAGDRGVAA